MSGKVKSDPLFLGLTRPPLIFGVSYMFAVLNIMVCLMYFVMSSDFKVVLFGIFFHGIGYLLALKEPLAIEILLAKTQKCNKCRNKVYHGSTNSYDMF